MKNMTKLHVADKKFQTAFGNIESRYAEKQFFVCWLIYTHQSFLENQEGK